MAFGRYKLIEIFTASPYHRKADLNKELTEDIFHNELFVEYDLYNILRDQIDNDIDTVPTTRTFVRYFKGYSGTGKTTFLHWFCKTNRNKIKSAIIDFAGMSDVHPDKSSGRQDYEYQLIDRLLKILYKITKKSVFSMSELLDHIYNNQSEYNCFYNYNESFFDILEETYANKMNSSENHVNSFLRKLNYSELFLILLLYYNKNESVFLECCWDQKWSPVEKDELLLIIDNIDSIKLEAISRGIPTDFAAIYENYVEIIRESRFFSTTKTINFIFSVRDTTYSVFPIQEADLSNEDCYEFSPNTIKMDQYTKRLKFARKYNVTIQANTEKLLQYIFNEDKKEDTLDLRRLFLPLFNYNHRKVMNFIDKLVTNNNIFFEFIDDLKDEDINIGVRGIFIFLFVRYLQQKDYFVDRIFFEETVFIGNNGRLNPARILLTILHNLGRFSLGQMAQTETVTNVGLFTLYSEYEKIFQRPDKEALFINTLSRLLLYYKNNWCHLLAITGTQIIDEESFDKELTQLKIYPEKDQYEKQQIATKLNQIRLNVTSSTFIYLKDIARHYEFFSYGVNLKPLFSCLHVTITNGKMDFDCIKNIEKTYEKTKSTIDSLKTVLNTPIHKYFEEGYSCFQVYNKDDTKPYEGFESDETFTGNKSHRLYVNRIIDFHTEYLDRFREYITTNQKVIQGFLKDLGDRYSREEIIFEINSKIINIIKLYIEDYVITTLNKNQVEIWIKYIQKKNIDEIEKLLSEGKNISERFIRINKGRNDKNAEKQHFESL
jgi:hypothetical protein